ncbi:MAG: histidine phosphatase family protein [Candidatus Omnitrophota bacterium]
MPTKLILIRHGQTQWNLKKKYCGFADIGLNATGKQQAKKLQKRLKNQVIDKIYVSDRKRAIQSAKILFKERKIKIVPGLKEMNFGIFEGLTYKQIIKKYGKLYSKWLNKPYSITLPKGEGLKGLEKRVAKAIKKIVSLNKNKTMAIVCHGGVTSAFLNYILKTKDFWGRVTDSTSLTIVEITNNKWKIILFNDTAHLAT